MKLKRKQFIARFISCDGAVIKMCPAFVEDFDYSHGPQKLCLKDLNKDQILTMFRNNVAMLVQIR